MPRGTRAASTVEPPRQKNSQANWPNIIKAVETPLGFYVLVVLVIEAMIGAVGVFDKNSEDTLRIVLIMAGIIVLLIVTVTILAFFPGVLSGKTTGAAIPDDVNSKMIPIKKVIKNPALLIAASEEFSNDINRLNEINESTALLSTQQHVEKNITAITLQRLLISRKFDIIQILSRVDFSTGSLIFSATETLNADGFIELVKICDAKLVIMAMSDSLVLGSKLVRVASVVAAAGNVSTSLFGPWEQCFYSMLSRGYGLAQSFDASQKVADVPLVIITNGDVAFGDA